MKQTIAVLLLLALAAASLAGCRRKPERQGSVTGEPVTDNSFVREADYPAVLAAAQETGLELEPGLYLTAVQAYTGVYPEDDAGEQVENVAAATLVNFSPLAYKYIEFTVTAGEVSYTFFVSTLPVGGKLTVVEKNKTPFAGASDPEAVVTSVEPFPNQPSMHPEALRLAYGDETVYAENICNEELHNVCVYYKTVNENGYLGGVTFRARLGDIDPERTAKTAAPGLKKNTGKILFVTIGQTAE